MAEEPTVCAICKIRRPRRHCPGVLGDICAICCGTERENTVFCPFHCVHLREARLREKDFPIHPDALPHPDVKLDESFLRRNEALLILLAGGLAQTALAQDHAIDTDVREVLNSVVQTYRTMASGLVYESRPDNPIAARIQTAFRERIREIEERFRENQITLRNTDLLGVLVFLQRLELQKNNRRTKSRAFIDFLREFFPPPEAPHKESSLILT